MSKAKSPPKLKVGDAVRVKLGVADPDYDDVSIDCWMRPGNFDTKKATRKMHWINDQRFQNHRSTTRTFLAL